VPRSDGHRYRGPQRGSASRFKGITPAGGKWRAQIKGRHLGLFLSEEDAARAYDMAAIATFGPDTYLNFPGGLPRAEVEDSSVCNKCGETKPLSEFSPDTSMRLGVRNMCKACSRVKNRAAYKHNYRRNLDFHLRRNFGITLDQYDQMVAEQAGVCAICGCPPTVLGGARRQGRPVEPRLVVDHCHATGRIRGLLCVECNRGIGFLKDDAAIVRFALKYLEERG
jgi:hypothetical protein